MQHAKLTVATASYMPRRPMTDEDGQNIYLLICMDLSRGLPKHASAIADRLMPCLFCTG